MDFSSCLSDPKPVKAGEISSIDFIRLGVSTAVPSKRCCGFLFFLSFKQEEVRRNKKTCLLLSLY